MTLLVVGRTVEQHFITAINDYIPVSYTHLDVYKRLGLMWLVGGLGFCGSLLAFVLSFIPPSQISTGSNTVWFSVLIILSLIHI